MSDPLSRLTTTDHHFTLPLCHAEGAAQELKDQQISVYAREVRAREPDSEHRPWLVYLQGGPGYGAPRPSDLSGWLAVAVTRFRVLLLDQRGTGRSTRLDATSLARLSGPEQQADYLSCFRADAIVADAEAIRAQLSPGVPWTILGQSFGGFCALTYLSHAPAGLHGAMITGGIPPVGVAVDAVYKATYARVLERNARFHQRYPDDAARLDAIVAYLEHHRVTLPGGSELTAQVLQLLGLGFGFSDGMEPVHYLLEDAFIEGPQGPELSFNFLHGVEQLLPFDTNLLFSILHESIYMDGDTAGGASNWAAARVRESFPQFDVSGQRPLHFTGEMVFPWMFETFTRLRPLAAAADILAKRDQWGPLYDEAALASNTVPVVAAIFEQDMYVERAFSEAVAARIPNFHTWVTPDWDHNALRVDPQGQVFTHLLTLLDQHA
ncbi:MAG: alpha/beta fold hydrolase [Pseudomonadales bacterium]